MPEIAAFERPAGRKRTGGRKPLLSDEQIQQFADLLQGGADFVSTNEPIKNRDNAYARAYSTRDRLRLEPWLLDTGAHADPAPGNDEQDRKEGMWIWSLHLNGPIVVAEAE